MTGRFVLTNPRLSTTGDSVADFTKLKVWQAAHAFTLEAYRITARFPREEQFGLTSQVRRAAISIAANIAESTGRHHGPDQARFLQVAKGSTTELRSHLLIARDLGFVTPEERSTADLRLDQIERMLASLLRYYKTH
jgi:four helix bundle protein